LGILLQRDAEAAATQLYTGILQKLRARIARWSGFQLSLLGRYFVDKQMLVSMFSYHARFVPLPLQLLGQVCSAVYTFVAANRPATAGVAALYPARSTYYRDFAHGGIRQVDIRSQLTTL
jgi:hypothetical protein